MSLLSSIQQIRARSVFIKVTPATRNLAESQLVYAALKKFGEVSSFHNKEYTNNLDKRPGTVIAMFDSEQAVESAREASPLRIPLPSHSHHLPERESNPESTPDSQAQAAESDKPAEVKAEANTDTTPKTTPPSPRFPRTHLEVRITPRTKRDMPNSTLLHILLTKQNPFYAPFEPDTSSPIRTDLLRKLKRGRETGLEGLADLPASQKKLFARARLLMGKNAELLALREKFGGIMGFVRDREADAKGARRGYGYGYGYGEGNGQGEREGDGYGDEYRRPTTMSALPQLQERMWKVMERLKREKRYGRDAPELEREVHQLSKEMNAMEAMRKKTLSTRRKEGETRFEREMGRRFGEAPPGAGPRFKRGLGGRFGG